MFTQKIPDFYVYILENLLITNWRNYGTDTDIASDKTAKDSSEISEVILRSFQVDDPAQIIFTSNDLGLGEDFMFFTDIIRGIKPLHMRTLNMPGYIVYISTYDYEGKVIVAADIMDNENFATNYIFIKNDDFSFFAPPKPEEIAGQEEQFNKEAENQEQAQAGVPMQPPPLA